jgi:hypothetical protein
MICSLTESAALAGDLVTLLVSRAEAKIQVQ